MAEVQKCAPAVTADGADADHALLPIAGRTHAHMHTHRALFSVHTCTYAQCILTNHSSVFTCTDQIAYSQTTCTDAKTR